jgi:hypothetical protein
MDYANLIGLGLTLFQSFHDKAGSKLPAEVAAAVAAAIAAIAKHHSDLITKANLEAQRG